MLFIFLFNFCCFESLFDKINNLNFNKKLIILYKNKQKNKNGSSFDKPEKFPAVSLVYSFDGKVILRSVNEFQSNEFSARGIFPSNSSNLRQKLPRVGRDEDNAFQNNSYRPTPHLDSRRHREPVRSHRS